MSPLRTLIRLLFAALPAHALNEQVGFFTAVPFGQGYGRYAYMVQTGCLAAVLALEMNVVVLVMAVGAGFPAECVFGTPFVVKHFMKQSFIQKRTQCPINRYPVMIGSQAAFNVIVSQRVTGVYKQVEYFFPAIGMPKLEVFQGLCGWGHK